MKTRVAVTYENGQVFQHFGHTEQFQIFTVEDGKILSDEIVSTNGSGHSLLADFLVVQGATVLICGGIGGGARTALAQAGIALYPGVTGDADRQAEALVAGTLRYQPDAVCAHHHGESENGGHACHEHTDGCAGGHC